MKLSIIICTRNVVHRLSRTLDSILAQTFPDYEVVIIDGVSTDGTLDIIKNYESKFAGKLKWISGKDSGVYEAMNKGVKKAQGEFLNVIGAGDWLEKDALGHAVRCVEAHPESDAVYGMTRVWDGKLKKHYDLQTSPEQLPAHPMQHPSLFYKKSLHDKFGLYDEAYRVAADYAFCLKAFYAGEAKAVPFRSVADNFVNDGLSSKDPIRCWQENKRALASAGIKHKPTLLQIMIYYKKILLG